MIARQFEGKILRSQGQAVEVPVGVEMAYDPDTDPLAVEVTFDTDEGEVTWTVGRDLMREGLNSPVAVGDGDVKFRCIGTEWPISGVVMCLQSPEGHADVGLPYDEVKTFLSDTQRSANEASKGFDAQLDNLIERILSS